jgi:predicted ATPase
LALGQTDAAAVAVDQMLAQCAATGFRFAEAELWRVRGETWRAYGRLDEAEACFQQAIAVAREQSAKSWELRAVLSLCRLREAEGPAPAFETAREQLVALYTWFTEGLDTPDLQEAARLL